MKPVVVVAVLDKKMGAFARPFFVPTVAMATRSFSDEVNRVAEDNQMHRHPEDFALYAVGEWYEDVGSFDNPDGVKYPRLVVEAQSVVKE